MATAPNLSPMPENFKETAIYLNTINILFSNKFGMINDRNKINHLRKHIGDLFILQWFLLVRPFAFWIGTGHCAEVIGFRCIHLFPLQVLRASDFSKWWSNDCFHPPPNSLQIHPWQLKNLWSLRLKYMYLYFIRSRLPSHSLERNRFWIGSGRQWINKTWQQGLSGFLTCLVITWGGSVFMIV